MQKGQILAPSRPALELDVRLVHVLYAILEARQHPVPVERVLVKLKKVIVADMVECKFCDMKNWQSHWILS
jgi:hypothetical protein